MPDVNEVAFSYNALRCLTADRQSHDGPVDGTQPHCRFMFTGREWNAQTGLSHHRARQYSPSLGRWTGPDPIGEAGGLNL